MKNKKVILTIIDGWGIAPMSPYNAIANAKTPNFDRLIREYPNTQLRSDGTAVGLPEGQFGTSEVNHLTIGAGRIILQDLPKINTAISSGKIYQNDAINTTIDHVVSNNSKLHFISILSDGGVHTHIDHLFEMIKIAKSKHPNIKISLHLFTDGRDVAPISAERYFLALEDFLREEDIKNVEISTIQGRAFLDRDRDWNKTNQAFNLMYTGNGVKVSDWISALNLSYNFKPSSDEKIGQYLINSEGLISKNDGIIFTHYRTDRIYQLIKRLIQENIPNLSITSMIKVSEEFKEVLVAFPREQIHNTLAEIISSNGRSQLHVTETEKYPHLTFFLNGEKEKELPAETWKMISSNRFIKPNYDIEPSMRNFDITNEVLNAIESDEFDFIVLNFSSPDMVGHTGNYHAAVVSAESVDYCLGKLYDAIKDKLDRYAMIVTADHGNSEIMWDEVNNQPHTQHTLSPVPFILISDIPNLKLHRRDSLQDIAPTILELMGLKKPEGVMTGDSLIIKNE
jgi:2,3-bisphosphoglycerate-independent phosphoglycerate mutase